MIDVTNSNFLELLPQIQKTISECDFVAIDTELSGTTRGRTLNSYDLPNERFRKVVDASSGFLILQFGLACFKSKPTTVANAGPPQNNGTLEESAKQDVPLQTESANSEQNDNTNLEVVDVQDVVMPDNQSDAGLDVSKDEVMKDLEEGEIEDDSSSDEDRPAKKELKKDNQARSLAYSCVIYNFYIFPQSTESWPEGWPDADTNRTFSMQASSVNFLCSHGFDFNKLFRDGISYLNRTEEQMIKDTFEKNKTDLDNAVLDKNGVPTFVPSDMKSYVRKALQQIKEYLNADPKKIVLSCLELESCPTNRRNMILEAIKVQPYFDQIEVQVIHDRERNERYISILPVDRQTKLDKSQRDFDRTRGFLQILLSIIGNRKPLVGHNLLLDLIRIMDQFFGPISEDYLSFKEMCHVLFSIIYDTKYIASTHNLDDVANHQTPLGDLYQILKQEPFPKIEIYSNDSESMDTQLHTAGCDAYLSGYCFIALCEWHLNYSKCDSETDNLPLISNERIRQAFCNKIFLTLSYDLKYFDLEKEDILPNRSHVYHVEFQTEDWKIEDIFKIFSQWGGVNVARIDKVSCFCALRNPDMVQRVNLAKIKPEFKCQVKPYHTYLYPSKQVGQ